MGKIGFYNEKYLAEQTRYIFSRSSKIRRN